MADGATEADAPRKRSDAQRNEASLLAAAAAAFVASGVDAPVRDIAARAGVGVGTIYRHFPTRADLIAAVYRHQVEACAQAGPNLLRDSHSPSAALVEASIAVLSSAACRDIAAGRRGRVGTRLQAGVGTKAAAVRGEGGRSTG